MFNLGAFGVTIEQHLCCHSQQKEAPVKHCNDNESCCDDEAGCCDEIVSQIKIAKDYTTQGSKISFEVSHFVLPVAAKFNSEFTAIFFPKNTWFAVTYYFPPPEDFQILYSSFLI